MITLYCVSFFSFTPSVQIQYFLLFTMFNICTRVFAILTRSNKNLSVLKFVVFSPLIQYVHLLCWLYPSPDFFQHNWKVVAPTWTSNRVNLDIGYIDTRSLYLQPTDLIMKHNKVEATDPSSVKPWTAPPLYSTRFATYISSMISTTVRSISFRKKKLVFSNTQSCSIQTSNSNAALLFSGYFSMASWEHSHQLKPWMLLH